MLALEERRSAKLEAVSGIKKSLPYELQNGAEGMSCTCGPVCLAKHFGRL
jgi:hypothetical protein